MFLLVSWDKVEQFAKFTELVALKSAEIKLSNNKFTLCKFDEGNWYVLDDEGKWEII